MTDIPIIFSAPMVRALLDGRKTMTRRLAWRERDIEGDGVIFEVRPSPWQKVRPGDRLWVRENFCDLGFHHGLTYLANWESDAVFKSRWPAHKITPCIHMPRKHSRITLVVTATKIERLQDISEEDARAEGIAWCDAWQGFTTNPGAMGGEHYHGGDQRKSFASLWVSLHGPESWADNPEVVALTFTVQRANIDNLPPQQPRIPPAAATPGRPPRQLPAGHNSDDGE